MHDRVAHGAVKFAGGLYRLHSGEAELAKAQVALWFAKPAGMSSETLYRMLEPEIQPAGVSLWRRQLVLGPAHEFCWHRAENAGFPEHFEALRVPLTLLWGGW